MPNENAISDLVQSSTIHGVGHIFSATNRCFRVLWTFLFVFGMCVIVVNIIFLLTKYFSNPELVNYNLDYEPFHWPQVTICSPAAPYYLKAGTPEFLNWKEIKKKTKVTMELLVNEIKEIKEQNKTDHEFEEYSLIMSSLNSQDIAKLSFKNFIGQVLYSMKRPLIHYSKDPFMDYQEFGKVEKLFSPEIVQITNNIPCQTFHVDKSPSINSKDIKALLFYITFDFDTYKLFNSSQADKQVYAYLTYGNEMIHGNEFVLSPGYNHVYEVAQSRYKSSGIRRLCRKHVFKVELYDATLQSTHLFEGNFENCKEILSQRIYVKECNCYSPYLPIVKNGTYLPKLCFNITHFSNKQVVENVKCMMRVYKLQMDNKTIFDRICKPYVPIKCDRLAYKFSVRKELLLDIWSKTYTDRRYAFLEKLYEIYFGKTEKDKVMLEKLRDSMIDLEIKREREFGDNYEEANAYPFSVLLSDIGGLMGLWLGLSVVGLFESVEFLYLVSKKWCCKTRKKNKVPDNIEQAEQCL